jgi:hypothetical protein
MSAERSRRFWQRTGASAFSPAKGTPRPATSCSRARRPAEKDDLCKFDGYRDLYERAREPKKLIGLPITHYEIYTPAWVEKSARLALDWFDQHLRR